MNCEQIKIDLLESFGEENISAELKEHLDSCSECNAYYHELIALSEFTGSDEDFVLTNQEIDEMVETVDQKINQSEVVANGTKSQTLWRYYLPVAAAVVLVFGLSWMGGLFSGRGTISDSNLADTIMIASNNTETTENVTGADLAYLINDYSSGVSSADADLVVEEITDEEYEYLAQNFDIGDIL